MIPARAFAGYDATTPLRRWDFERRDPGPRDVVIDILFCGVCHSDLHTVKGDWGPTAYPCVPGHEIVGRAMKVGAQVRKFREGDMVGVGCMVDSCKHCEPCERGLEQFCRNGFTGTYGGIEKETGRPTYGGYSTTVVVDEAFVLRIPDGLDPAAAAPLLCAGVTTWSPLRHWKVGPGRQVAVVGLGGLGHMGLKFAHALGAEVTLFTTSPGKEADARRLGATDVVISRDPAQMKAQRGRFDFILDTVSANHDLDALLACVKLDGHMVIVGGPPEAYALNAFSLIFQRRSLAGSLIGGIPETQEMLDFCGEHAITSDVEMIRMDQINEAYERMVRSDVKYRFVIDMATLKAA
jgi:uncharacterized zinc-type alcohol dehydrogenase-like protein